MNNTEKKNVSKTIVDSSMRTWFVNHYRFVLLYTHSMESGSKENNNINCIYRILKVDTNAGWIRRNGVTANGFAICMYGIFLRLPFRLFR